MTTSGGRLRPPPLVSFSPARLDYRAYPNHCPWRTEPALELLRDDPLRRVCGLLGDDVSVSLNSYREDYVLPLVDCEELVDVAVQLGEGNGEIGGLFAEQRNKNGSVVVEGIRSHIVEGLLKGLVGP